ncbi:unnamed protein product [Rotaria sp. Silwood1]|nr:unnamed protein product [Rotaria sp. Silwood1]CAF0946519.1 unnamed protein product [Rotaria sp. Silwood1]
MKTNIKIKDEPNEIQTYSSTKVKESLHLYDCNQIKNLKTTSTNDSMTNLLVNQEQESSICTWCQKLGRKSFMFNNDNDDTKILCSEVCFNQYRRASFKKNKDKKSLKTHQTIKIKSTNFAISEKISKPKISDNKHNHQQKRLSSRKSKIHKNEISRKFSRLPSLKRYRSSSSSNETMPTNRLRNFTCSSSRFSPPVPIGFNHFQYPFATIPSLQQLSPPLLFRPTSSTLFPMLTKDLLSNHTCILPSFIPLAIPIPLCFPVPSPCIKPLTDCADQGCIIEIRNNINSFSINQQHTRRISI